MLCHPLTLPQLCRNISILGPSTRAVISRLSLQRTLHQSIAIRNLATMTSTQSKACCTVPPVVAEGYKEKGEYLTIEGMKTYATQVSPRSPTSPTPPSIPVSTNRYIRMRTAAPRQPNQPS